MFFIPKLFKSYSVLIKFQNDPRHRLKSWFNHISLADPPPLLRICKEFKKDPAKNKVNLAVSVYRDACNNPYVLKCVRQAEAKMFKQKLDKVYFKISGLMVLRQKIAEFVLGKDSPFSKPDHQITIQCISGTGGLSIVSQFLAHFFPGKKVIYVPKPTAEHHTYIFCYWGLQVKTYRYLNSKDMCFDFKGMMDDISKMPERSIIFIQANAHNPTGFDPNTDEWKQIAERVKEKCLYVVMENANQGFASGCIEKDACGLRIMAEACINMCIITSFSKNLALYGEPIGGMTFIVDNKKEISKILTNAQTVIRASFANPPHPGSRIVHEILGNQDLQNLWNIELEIMVKRIRDLRQLLLESLVKAKNKNNWEFLIRQKGILAYTGFKPEQVKQLKKNFHVYSFPDGSISLGRITNQNMKHVFKAIHEVSNC